MKDSSSPRQPPPPASTAARPSREARGWLGGGRGGAPAHSVGSPPAIMAQGSSSHCLASIPQVVSETETPDPWISRVNMTLALPLWEEKPFCPSGVHFSSSLPGAAQDPGAWKALLSWSGAGG